MARGFRIVKAAYAATAFDGAGARRFGGRWNSTGTAVIYTAGSLSLATLELLVHLQNSSILAAYSSIPVEFDDGLVEVLGDRDLPSGWARYPAPSKLQEIGDVWVATERSAVLRVPSVIVPSEANYLLNPAHPEFFKVRIGSATSFELDRRLVPRSKG
jgi:RES domain-containing protein